MPPDAHADAMSETLTPQEAVRALTKAQSWEASLLSRTAGLTWMVWGIATPATFLTYAFVAVLGDLQGFDVPWWVWNLLWVPWVAMGVATTVSLWRSAALAVPDLDSPRDRRHAMVGGIVSSLLMFGAFLLLQPPSAVLPLGAIGAMWALMAIANVWRADRHSRVVGVVVGVTLIASAALMALLRLGVEASGILSIVVAGVVPFAAGLWHLARA
ncbi:MAG TPA: hypothetical protein VNX21_07495 [Candidatus Thermoplasmatota archaeon]|nr:hypothetical protein [Candidatus Thermoplasmatota archaeon]